MYLKGNVNWRCLVARNGKRPKVRRKSAAVSVDTWGEGKEGERLDSGPERIKKYKESREAPSTPLVYIHRPRARLRTRLGDAALRREEAKGDAGDATRPWEQIREWDESTADARDEIREKPRISATAAAGDQRRKILLHASARRTMDMAGVACAYGGGAWRDGRAEGGTGPFRGRGRRNGTGHRAAPLIPPQFPQCAESESLLRTLS
ncbi:hypothetical protein K438DRAFT_1783184 [Mycena galopus ATCC 62051]|nr:hypothetical protein K438DRAFT_1783184 [Mycena galopus ATCC 62051]